MEQYFIYGLVDPREPKRVMVVGKTKWSLPKRLQGYIQGAKRKLNKGYLLRSDKWVLKLLDSGVRPTVRLLAITDKEHWKACEKRFITIWRKRNPALLNVHSGGNGCDSNQPKLICDKCGTQRIRGNSGFHCRICEGAKRNGCTPGEYMQQIERRKRLTELLRAEREARQRKRIDTERVAALYRPGRSVRSISKEVNHSHRGVKAALQRMRVFEPHKNYDKRLLGKGITTRLRNLRRKEAFLASNRSSMSSTLATRVPLQSSTSKP